MTDQSMSRSTAEIEYTGLLPSSRVVANSLAQSTTRVGQTTGSNCRDGAKMPQTCATKMHAGGLMADLPYSPLHTIHAAHVCGILTPSLQSLHFLV
jgi:hypothetical protein